MSPKSRVELNQLVEQNIYDNNNKEILAEMLREVLLEYITSNFNLIDDELKEVKYNSTQTLEQYLDTVIGAVPVYGVVEGVNVGASSGSLTTSGIISSASYTGGGGNSSLITINFSESIANKILIPVLTTTSLDYNAQNTLLVPVIRVEGSQTITITIREFYDGDQNVNIKIIVM